MDAINFILSRLVFRTFWDILPTFLTVLSRVRWNEDFCYAFLPRQIQEVGIAVLCSVFVYNLWPFY